MVKKKAVKKTKPKPGKSKRRAKAGAKPLTLTADMQDRFLKAIRLGCPIKDACGCAGFSEGWYYDSKARAEENPALPRSKVFAKFYKNIKEVQGQATNRWLAMIEKAAMQGTWTAAAWKLERTRGMAQRVRTEGEINVNANVTVESSRERLLDKLASLASKLETGDDS